MTARAELLPNRILAAGLLTMALLVGVLAGYSPPLAVGLTLGLVFVTVTLANLTAGVCIFAVLSFLDTVLPVQSGLSAPKLLGLMLMLSWLAMVTAGEREHRERIFSHPAFLFVLMLFLGWSLISATWAEYPGAAIAAFTRYLPNALLFLIVFAAVRTRDQLLWVVGAFVIGAFLSGVYGIWSHRRRRTWAAGRRRWRPQRDRRGDGRRPGAGDRAAVAVRGKPLVRMACSVAVVVCTFALPTSSRGGLIALGVALIAAVFLGGRRRGTMLMAALGAVLVTVFYFATIRPGLGARARDSPRGRHRPPTSGRSAGGWSGTTRSGGRVGHLTNASIHYLLEPGKLVRDDFIVDTPKVAHNTYLQVPPSWGSPASSCS